MQAIAVIQINFTTLKNEIGKSSKVIECSKKKCTKKNKQKQQVKNS